MDVNSLLSQIKELQEQNSDAINSKQKIEQEFNEQRAAFKEMFLRKDAELKEERTNSAHLQDSLKRVEDELVDIKAAVKMKDEEIAFIQQNYKDEMASIQHIMRESVNETVNDSREKYQAAYQAWAAEKASLVREIEDLKIDLANEKDDTNILHVISKSIKKVTSENLPSIPFEATTSSNHATCNEPSNEELEEAMKRAQQDVDTLKSIIEPYQEEIASLKSKVREAYQQIDEYEKNMKELLCHQGTQERLEELQQLLEIEKKNNEALKNTWQKANEQYFRQQSLAGMELRICLSLLTPEQKETLSDLKSKEAFSLGGRLDSSPKLPKLRSVCCLEEDSCSLSSFNDESFLLGESPVSVIKKSHSGSDLVNPSVSCSDSSTKKETAETQSLSDFRTLSRKQSCQTPDQLYGTRLISEKEWTDLQFEIQKARRKDSRECAMCKNYEEQLQAVQADFREINANNQILDSKVHNEQKVNQELHESLEELEASIKQSSVLYKDKMSHVMDKLEQSQEVIASLKGKLASYKANMQEELRMLSQERDELQGNIDSLEDSYNDLVGRRQSSAAKLRDEVIDLPSKIDDLQVVALKLREDYIQSIATREHLEERFQVQLGFLKERVKSEETQSSQLQDNLQSEIAARQMEEARCADLKTELERVSNQLEETEIRLRSTEENYKKTITEMRGLEAELRAQVTRLQAEVTESRRHVANLQNELQNAESVQKDFVQLSQTLQIQLESLRQQETEVRWQFNEDAVQCASCQQIFSSSRKKYHCLHCCKIFCNDCSNKTVPSGPLRRLARVCSKCHTMLVKDAVPYFSNDTYGAS